MDNESTFVINPTSGRPIKIGGRVYNILKKQGYVESAMDIERKKEPKKRETKDDFEKWMMECEKDDSTEYY